ncbi:uncharacterized protein LY89DRAFT_616056 [Mollisia scopiformis]|uniref:Zn(2)-C6 fungal-type domain-containing protein n=1 Tax=Mollisia scopiformis TaxID=149040 RepID=A0A194XCA0_MOLSC|nr:uncharacterized protein LY89DRAFT_616056 [Mollisia scopiformis]KUJ17789.1 hypothetical protein LY89DRAFT_616056 [Mollisia scopiformis]
MSANEAECLRTVLSCARCRRRKIKCDRLVPVCSRCKTARSACTAFNPRGDTEIPRSIVHFLEHEIATLEKEFNGGDLVGEFESPREPGQLSQTQQNFDIGRSPALQDAAEVDVAPLAGVIKDPMRRAIVGSVELQSMIGATMPAGTCLTDMISNVRMGLTPSYTPSSPTATPIQCSVTAKQDDEYSVDASILVQLPGHVVNSLVKKYIQRVLPMYPFLHEPTVWGHVQRAINKLPVQEVGQSTLSVRPDYDFLITYLILAISATLGSANSGHEARCMAFSGSLFTEGISHLSSKAPFPNDLAEIQSTLLILQYALINPKYANVWVLSGVVMRSCLDLGLHREVLREVGLDSLTIDIRRQVFWVAYCMDRSICSALQRPLSIPDPTINTLFPALPLSQNGEHRPDPGKALALRQIQFSKLQSTIIEVHFQGKQLDQGQTWDDWLATTDQSLRDWYEVLPPDEDPVWSELAFSQGLTNLYRPSPRMPFPSRKSLMVAFEAACGSAHIYQQHITSGFFRRPWLAAHNTFSSAMVTLFCLRYGYEPICERWNAGEIFQMTKLFTSNLLTLSSQGWGEISKYAGTYERLLGPLLDSVFTKNSSPSKSFGPAQDAELARLIYPGPAHLEKLRFGNARLALEDDFQGFDAAMFNWEDLPNTLLGWDSDIRYDYVMDHGP